MIRALVLGLGLGLIVVPISELMFWPIAPQALPGLVGFYGCAALLCALWVDRVGMRGWASVALAGGIFGWLIEGVVVGQAYEAVPFSLIWTPLAWHMLLSVGIGVVGLRRALLARSPWPAVLSFGLFGAFAGLWGAYGWTALANEGGAQAMGFATQICVATAMLVLGHLTVERAPDVPSPGVITVVLAVLAALVWLGAWALPLFPVSLSVPVLIAISLWAMTRLGGQGPTAWGRVIPKRYLSALALPVTAIPLQSWVIDAAWVSEMNVWVALPSALLGAGAWCLAVVLALKPRRAARHEPASGSHPND